MLEQQSLSGKLGLCKRLHEIKERFPIKHNGQCQLKIMSLIEFPHFNHATMYRTTLFFMVVTEHVNQNKNDAITLQALYHTK